MKQIDLEFLTGLFMLEDQNKLLKFNAHTEEQIKDIEEREKRLKVTYSNIYVVCVKRV